MIPFHITELPQRERKCCKLRLLIQRVYGVVQIHFQYLDESVDTIMTLISFLVSVRSLLACSTSPLHHPYNQVPGDCEDYDFWGWPTGRKEILHSIFHQKFKVTSLRNHIYRGIYRAEAHSLVNYGGDMYVSMTLSASMTTATIWPDPGHALVITNCTLSYRRWVVR